MIYFSSVTETNLIKEAENVQITKDKNFNQGNEWMTH